MWKLGSDSGTDMVVIIGRQRPPEVTGSLALMTFVDTLAGDGDLAGRFRRRFALLVVPLMNPDGVESGYWRCNLNRVDINRDWEQFNQPETPAVPGRRVYFVNHRCEVACLDIDAAPAATGSTPRASAVPVDTSCLLEYFGLAGRM